jgi:LPXTG-motif cell wall-anchored protein
MKNTMKRFLALFAMVCVLASAMSLAVFAAPANILEDGSFESLGANGYQDWSSGWDLYWFPPRCADDYDAAKEELYIPNDPDGAHSGNYYLMNDRSGWFGICEPSVELEAGDYEMSIWVKAVEGGVRINGTVFEGPDGLHILETDGNNDQPSVDLTESDEWKQVTFKFTITVPGVYKVRFGMNAMGYATPEYHFDDFVLTKAGSNPNTGDSLMAVVGALLVSGAALVVLKKKAN